MPSHHPDELLLMNYATGSLHEPVALLVATHLALCPLCRQEAQAYDTIGGALLEDIDPEPVSGEALERALARLEAPEAGTAPGPRTDGDPRLPRPLRDYVDGRLDSLPWKSRGSVAEAGLLTDRPGYRTRLLRIRAGVALPRHTHVGSEYTLVLAGGFTDSGGHYLRGDVAMADASVTHKPVADEGEECICLAVTDAPLRLTGPLGRLLNPFVRL